MAGFAQARGGMHELTEEEQLEMALRLSMQVDDPTAVAPAAATGSTAAAAAAVTSIPGMESIDPAMLETILQSLPGVDLNDPEIIQMIRDMQLSTQENPPPPEGDGSPDDPSMN